MIFTQGRETEEERLEGRVCLAVLAAAYDLGQACDHDPNRVFKAFRGKEAALFERISECGIKPFSSFNIK